MRVTWKEVAVFAVLTVIWGTTWAAIRIGLEGIPPVTGVAPTIHTSLGLEPPTDISAASGCVPALVNVRFVSVSVSVSESCR